MDSDVTGEGDKADRFLYLWCQASTFRQKSSVILHVQVRQGSVLALYRERVLKREKKRERVPMHLKKTIV